MPASQDVIVSVYNIHHSSAVWDEPEHFLPERFSLDEAPPTEANTDYRQVDSASLAGLCHAVQSAATFNKCLCRYIPFSGGPRKCVGDQFALMEAVVTLAVALKQFNFSMVPGHDPGMTTGATIHTAHGMYMHITARRH